MAYNIIPKSLQELTNVHSNASELTELYTHIVQTYKINNPFSFDKTKLTSVKVIRALQNSLDLKKFKSKTFKLDWGNGSRGNGGLGNRGNVYEAELMKDLESYIAGKICKNKNKDAIDNIMNLIPDGFFPKYVKSLGSLNQKRSFDITPTSIVVGKKNSNKWDIGSTVTDIDLVCENLNGVKYKLHLSLKYGGTVSFINAGVTKYLSKTEIERGLIKNSNGISLLKLFDIDNARFCEIFNKYTGKGSGKFSKDITTHLKQSNLFKEFMRSVIGFGYILVHKNGNKTYITDMTEKVMENMIDINTAHVIYPVHGSAKRIDVDIKMKGIDIKVNIRNSSGKIYPSHLYANYTMKH
jgi:hypothetical protein